MKEWLRDLPSTNLRIVITLLLVVGTAIHYWITTNPPDREWLVFLAVMAGIDAAQHFGKRVTEHPAKTTVTTEAGPPATITTTTTAPTDAEGGSVPPPTTVIVKPGAIPEHDAMPLPTIKDD